MVTTIGVAAATTSTTKVAAGGPATLADRHQHITVAAMVKTIAAITIGTTIVGTTTMQATTMKAPTITISGINTNIKETPGSSGGEDATDGETD